MSGKVTVGNKAYIAGMIYKEEKIDDLKTNIESGKARFLVLCVCVCVFSPLSYAGGSN